MKFINLSLAFFFAVCFTSIKDKLYYCTELPDINVYPQIKSTLQKTDSISEAGTFSFELSGAWSGEKKGKAITTLHFASKRHFATILFEDIDEKNPEFVLKFRVESWDPIGLPTPGSYPIIERGEPESGYDVGFEVTYTHILKYGGGQYYANTALEYKAPDSWMSTPKGEIIIESVTETHVYGSFEFELWEHASINKAPMKNEKITIKNGRFSALIV